MAVNMLRRALDILTEGEDAEVPRLLRAEALDIQKTAVPWISGRGIQGVGIAPKVTKGELQDEIVLKIYVEKKLPKSKVRYVVPGEIPFPGLGISVATDVEEIGKVEPEVFSGRVRPASPASSIGHPSVSAGTFGCLVRKRGTTTGLYILSNSHVIANEGLARIGDPIIQPGKADGGRRAKDEIAKLADWMPFKFSRAGYPNFVDAAIARVRSRNHVTSVIRGNGVPTGASVSVRRDMKVQKTGRTTDRTTGTIKDVDFRIALQYKRPTGTQGRVGFKQQVLCTRFTSDGDSGSLVLNMNGKAVGLHFAGSPSTSIFNRIAAVLNAFKIEIVTDGI